VACISGETKVKNIVEGLSGMKDEREKIDLLLARNADEQLSKVDWDELHTAISNRLYEAQQRKTSVFRFPTIFKLAAAITMAAAIVFIAVTVKLKRPAVEKLGGGRTALVEFVERKGSASVALIEPSKRTRADVYIAGRDERFANCYVQIIDSSVGPKEDVNRPSWFIICMSQYSNGNDGINRDAIDMLYLF
jgi:hypothetical protein